MTKKESNPPPSDLHWLDGSTIISQPRPVARIRMGDTRIEVYNRRPFRWWQIKAMGLVFGWEVRNL